MSGGNNLKIAGTRINSTGQEGICLPKMLGVVQFSLTDLTDLTDWESKGTPLPMPTPARNKALLRGY